MVTSNWYNRYMQIFIASPWKNKESVERLTEELTKRGYGVYSFLQSGANLLTGISIEDELAMFHKAVEDWEHDPRIRKIYESEMAGLKASDAVILVNPAGHTSFVEAGMGCGMGKKVVAIGPVAKPEIFYLACHRIYPDIDAFLADLSSILPL